MKLRLTVLVVLFCLTASTAIANEFEQDIDVARRTIEQYAGNRGLSNNDRTRFLDALRAYADKRRSALQSMLRVLESYDSDRILDTWNNQCEQGISALEGLSRAIPFDTIGLREFGEKEMKLFRGLKEKPIFATTRVRVIQINRKTIEAANKLDETWKNIERQDYAFDEMAKRVFESEYKPAMDELKKWLLKGLLKEAVEMIGHPEMKPVIEPSVKAIAALVKQLEEMRKETLIWRTFVAEREVAAKIHSEIRFDQVERAISDAKSMSENPGDRLDYRSFESKAMDILKSAGREPYDRFMEANRGKFIELVESRWKEILTDPEDFKGYEQIFQLDTETLPDLLRKWEEEAATLTDGPFKRSIKAALEKLKLDGQKRVQIYLKGKADRQKSIDEIK